MWSGAGQRYLAARVRAKGIGDRSMGQVVSSFGVSGLFSLIAGLAMLSALLPSAALSKGKTLENVRQRGFLVCGVQDGRPGLAKLQSSGQWAGLEIDFCRAVAAAVFDGDSGAIRFRPLSVSGQFRKLNDGSVDLIASAGPWTLSRDTEFSGLFVDALLHDGQRLLVRRSHGVASALELSGASICVLVGTRNAHGLEAYFNSRRMRHQLVTSDRWDDLVQAYANGGCTALTGDMSVLAAERMRFAAPREHMMLPEVVSPARYGPVVRRGDDQWFSIVRWVLMALINAEERGISSKDADALQPTTVATRAVMRLGGDAGAWSALGLSRGWPADVVRSVGNYGEIFRRNLGEGSPLKLQRGPNALWAKGGLMQAAPLR